MHDYRVPTPEPISADIHSLYPSPGLPTNRGYSNRGYSYSIGKNQASPVPGIRSVSFLAGLLTCFTSSVIHEVVPEIKPALNPLR